MKIGINLNSWYGSWTTRAAILALTAALGASAFGQVKTNSHQGYSPIGVTSSSGANTLFGMSVPSVVNRSRLVGPLNASTKLYIDVALRLPNPTALKTFNNDVSNPKSSTYREFITPAQFGAKFGQPASVVNSVAGYLQSQGLKVTLVAKNNLNIMATGTAKQVAAAFGTTINSYHANANEQGRIDYYSFSTPPKAPASLARYMLDVDGMQNFTIPHPATTLTPGQMHTLYDTLPMINANFAGQGVGIGISNWDGFQLSNVPLFYAQYNLPTPAGGVLSNVTVVTVDGGSQNNPPGGEGDLDIQMVLGEAPLCHLYDYDGGGLIDVLTREADDNVADIFSESWIWGLDPGTAEAANQAHQQMTAQGQTYMHATGDSGTSILGSYPDSDPEPLGVGGTAANTDANGTRLGEVAWNGGGGGWTNDSTFPFNTLPAWQTGFGVPTNVNQRLQPDVAIQASGDQVGYTAANYFFYNGQLTADSIGTSFASPSFAGLLGTTESWLDANGWTGSGSGAQLNRFGRVQDLFYSMNATTVSPIWYDVTVGDTGPLPDGSEATAKPGWDFCTGLGSPDFYALAYSISTFPVSVGSGTATIYSDPANGTLGTNPTGSGTNLTGTNGISYNVSSVQSVYGPAVGLKVQFTVPSDNFTSLSLTLRAAAATGATLFVYALDSNQQYDLISTQTLTGTSSTISVNNILPYVQNGSLTLVTRAIIPSRFNLNQFTFSLDQATMTGYAHH